MKQIIVLVAMILLGTAIYQMVAGDGDASVYSTVKDVWAGEIETRTMTP